MADQGEGYREHFFVSNFTTSHGYQRPPREIRQVQPPPIDRNLHGRSMLRQIGELERIAADADARKADLGFADGSGLIIEIEGRANLPLALESIEVSGIELLNLRHITRDAQTITLATVYVPAGKLAHFERAFRQYIDEDTAPSRDFPNGRPKRQDLVESIDQIRRAAFDALWTDPPDALPNSDDEETWWEVWLPVRGNRGAVTQRFRAMAETLNLSVSDNEQHLRERTVTFLHASRSQIETSLMLLDCVAEIRQQKKLADFYLGLNSTHQRNVPKTPRQRQSGTPAPI